MKESGQDSVLWIKFLFFCDKYDIQMLEISDMFSIRERKRRKFQTITNMHHYYI